MDCVIIRGVMIASSRLLRFSLMIIRNLHFLSEENGVVSAGTILANYNAPYIVAYAEDLQVNKNRVSGVLEWLKRTSFTVPLSTSTTR